MPAGFCVWSFSLFNAGEQQAMLTRIALEVTGDGECPAGARFDQLKPTLDPFDDIVELAPGALGYRPFKGKKFSYEPKQGDAFRLQLVFVLDGAPRFQRLRPVLHWSDATGDHLTYAPELFLASHPAPDLARARQKLGVGDG
jgi:hypothetical protein